MGTHRPSSTPVRLEAHEERHPMSDIPVVLEQREVRQELESTDDLDDPDETIPASDVR